MRTKPASTIGDIGTADTFAATASAAGDNFGCGEAAIGPARKRSITTEAPDALKDERVSMSVMAKANQKVISATSARRQGRR